MKKLISSIVFILCAFPYLLLAEDLEYNLTDAISRGDFEYAEELIKKGADVNKKIPPFNQPPIVMAPLRGIKFVELLIKNGADVNATDQDNTTALINACLYGNIEIVKYLLSTGADIHAINNDDINALESAKLSKDQPLIKFIKSAISK
jgi:ankyrin repeat protein